MTNVIKGINPLLTWISDLLALFQAEPIRVPKDYREQVIEIKNILNNDPCGLVSSILDFAISCSAVEFKIETDNKTLTKVLNSWLKEINISLRGKIPTGIEPLSKEYFRERWKGSSNLLLRSFWTDKKDFILPTTLFFVDGEDILCKDPKDAGAIVLGSEKYFIRVDSDEKNDIALPSQENELIFVQKPYEAWGIRYPVPFLIKRGLYKNLKFYALLSSKSEYIVARALEYLMLMKKGTERLTLEGKPEYTYSEEDLKGIRDDLKQLLMQKKNEAGVPIYATNFDTVIEHFIPEYSKALNEGIYTPIEKRLLSGLGLVEIIEGLASTRREAILNPKPFIEEINQGIKDFEGMLLDIVYTIIDKNKAAHPKFMNSEIRIIHSPVTAFLNDKMLTLMRSIYDRGRISSQTLLDLVGLDFDVEVQRRKDAKSNRDEQTLYPPIIQNQEQFAEKENVTEDKKSIEKRNFTNATVECSLCGFEDYGYSFLENIEEASEDCFCVCPSCEANLNEDQVTITRKKKKIIKTTPEYKERVIFDESHFKTNKDLPEQTKELPSHAKLIFRKAFNTAYSKLGEETAFKVAWSAVKKTYKKIGNKWIKKNQGLFEINKTIEESMKEFI